MKTLAAIIFAVAFIFSDSAIAAEPTVNIRQSQIKMPDGVKLSATFYEPKNIGTDEKLPVLLELLPYRKDDSFYMRDYPLHTYFAEHGFISVKVDIRGTGSSEGKLPDREYSDTEINDAICLIDQLSKLPRCNGKVGMWGISWGGFNSLMVAMKNPPALGAVLAAHVSDDLYHDDVHYQDGCLHFDWYNLEIDHENGLPASPDYRIDTDFIKNRFETYPWVLNYLHQQQDGKYWRERSLRDQYDKIKIPCYVIGGLLDGYRDTPVRMLENIKTPLKVEIGPWNHSWPDNGTPGPNYEWRQNACQFFKKWLSDKKIDRTSQSKKFLVFLRDGHPPDDQLKLTPGKFLYLNWPNENEEKLTFYPDSQNKLETGLVKQDKKQTLTYVATKGHQAGFWWGEPTDDMRDDDAYSFTFDTNTLDKNIIIAGAPKVNLKVSCTAPQANFSARLEDVFPDGRVSLVTGGILNASQRKSSLQPSELLPNQQYNIEWPMHFTTWTFKPGHKIRLAISNSQFPMAWPSPHKMTSTVYFGKETKLTLPEIETNQDTYEVSDLPVAEPRAKRPNCLDTPETSKLTLIEDLVKNTVTWRDVMHHEYALSENKYSIVRTLEHTASAKNPADANFHGNMITTICNSKRKISLETDIKVVSNLNYFNVTILRNLKENDKQVATKTWSERIKREFQ